MTKKIFLILILILIQLPSYAKEFTLNCAAIGDRREYLFTFDDVKKIVSSGNIRVVGNFYENEILFKFGDWHHSLNRITGNLTVSKDGEPIFMKCSLVKERMF
jgi:hypothetical protein